jgi:hypothetical protein
MSENRASLKNEKGEEFNQFDGSSEHKIHMNSGTVGNKHPQAYSARYDNVQQPRRLPPSDPARVRRGTEHKSNREKAQTSNSGGLLSYLGYGHKTAATPHQYNSDHIEAQIRELTGELARRDERIERLSEEQTNIIKNFKRHVESLEAKLESQEIELKTTKEDLLAIRKFAVVHDTRDAHSLIQSFKDMNDGISDIAFILSQFQSNMLPRTLSNEQLEQLHRQLGSGPALHQFMRLIIDKKASPSDFIFFLSRALLCTQLHTKVFNRFHPLINKAGDDLLQKIHCGMLNSEPQEKLGQWRAIAYMHSSPTEEEKESLLRQHSKEVLAFMAIVFDGLIPEIGNNNEELMGDCGGPLLRLFKRAVSLQEEIRSKYLLCDYQIYSVDGQIPFKRDTMEAEGKRPNPDKVVFTISLGMRSQKNILRDKALKQERSCIVKAVVLGNNWAPAT